MSSTLDFDFQSIIFNFSKILDINHCSLMNFDAKKMYYFISVRFKKTSAKVQGQALTWLQVR